MPGGWDFAAAVLGGALPEAAEAALREASELRGDRCAEEAALERAQVLAPGHPAVLIAWYRWHFYGNRFDAARGIAMHALESTARVLGLPEDWRQLPDRPLGGAEDDVATRFYLWILKGYAYLSLRLGEADVARDVLAKLRTLDPDDHVGAALLEAVRQRRERDADDVDDEPALPILGAAAWARVDDRARRGRARM